MPRPWRLGCVLTLWNGLVGHIFPPRNVVGRGRLEGIKEWSAFDLLHTSPSVPECHS